MRKHLILILIMVVATCILSACTAKKPEFIYKQLTPATAPMNEVLPGVSLKGTKLEILSSLSKAGHGFTIPSDYIIAFYSPLKNQKLTGVLAQTAAIADKDPNRDLGYRCSHAADTHLCRAFTNWYNAMLEYYLTRQGLPDQFTFALAKPKDQAHENYISLTKNYLRLNPSSYYKGEWPYYEITLFGQKRKFRIRQLPNKDTEGSVTAPRKIGELYEQKTLPPKMTSNEITAFMKKELSKVGSLLGEGKQIVSKQDDRGMTVWRVKDKLVRLTWQGRKANNAHAPSGWVSLHIEGYDEADPQDIRENMVKYMQGVFHGDIELQN